MYSIERAKAAEHAGATQMACSFPIGARATEIVPFDVFVMHEILVVELQVGLYMVPHSSVRLHELGNTSVGTLALSLGEVSFSVVKWDAFLSATLPDSLHKTIQCVVLKFS